METMQSNLDAARLVYFMLLALVSLAIPWTLYWRGLGIGSTTLLAAPRSFWPLLATVPAVLLALGREAAFLQALNNVGAAPLAVGGSERLLLAIYLAAGAALYYRLPEGRMVWGVAALLCAVPMLLAMQAAFAGGFWADESGGGGNLLPELFAFCLSFAAWVGMLLVQRSPTTQPKQALA